MGVGVIFAGGAGFGAGFLVVVQPLMANENLTKVLRSITMFFSWLFSLLSNFIIRNFAVFYTVSLRASYSQSLPIVICGIIY